MTDFYVRTDAGSSGPFTGVELREAALAGLLTPEATISSTPQGPWTPAFEAGLFNERRIPLPHPAGVIIPVYHVSGLSESFRGPFKLRELIGFAARGLLPADATLRADSSHSWIPVSRIHIIAATLRGDLALIDASGKVIRRTARMTSLANQADVKAPVTIAKAAVHSASQPLMSEPGTASPSQPQPESTQKTSSPKASSPPDLPSAASTPRGLDGMLSRLRKYGSYPTPALIRRTAVAVTLVLIVATVGYGITQRKQATLPRDVSLGDWVVPSGDETECHSGLSLRSDGRCVVFNSKGPCWTGEFRWHERTNDTRGLRGLETTLELDAASPQHPIEPVGSTDGYLRFVGVGDSLPIIDGHRVSDAFVQKIDQRLRLGYLVSIDISANRKQLNAAWISFNKQLETSDGAISEEVVIEQLPPPEKMVPLYGMPDEARPIQRHEIPRDKMADRYLDAQLIRYKEFRFALTVNESWQPVTSEFTLRRVSP